MRGEVETIRSLCRAGRDPNEKMVEWFDSEPLGWAASFGQLDSVRVLIEFGADPLRPPNKAGVTPMSDARRERHQHVIRFLEEYQQRAEGLSTPSPGEVRRCPPLNPSLNGELNDCARNTNDTGRLRDLVARGADLTSTNGAPWHHTPMHQSAYHNRPDMVETLVELCAERGVLERVLAMGSNPCGSGGSGTPADLARARRTSSMRRDSRRGPLRPNHSDHVQGYTPGDSLGVRSARLLGLLQLAWLLRVRDEGRRRSRRFATHRGVPPVSCALLGGLGQRRPIEHVRQKGRG